jgi:hypothetical protein
MNPFCFLWHSKSSLEKAKAWVNELQRQANPNIVIALVGNKVGLLALLRDKLSFRISSLMTVRISCLCLVFDSVLDDT